MGLTAGGLHGSRWLDDRLPIELVTSNARPPRRVRTHDLRVHPEELMWLDGLPVDDPGAHSVRHRTAPSNPLDGRPDGRPAARDGYRTREGAGDRSPASRRARSSPAGDGPGVGRRRRAVATGELAAADPDRGGDLEVTTNAGPGSQSRRPDDVLPRSGVGRRAGRGGVRRRPAPH